MGCPLCETTATVSLGGVHGRIYSRCRECRLAFLDRQCLPSLARERAEYELHENSPQDAGYRGFLMRLAEPLSGKLPSGARGIDYGCGPSPVLAQMLRERGLSVSVYDPFFADDPALLADRYDFVSCTEVVEHLHRPATDFALFDRLLVPGGWLGVMTEVLEDEARFLNWWYLRDPTHCSFYSHETFQWVARRFGWSLEMASRTVALFRKGSID